MPILTPAMKRMLDEQRLGFVATVCPDGTPNLSPKGTTTAWDDDHLVFADIHSPGTIANLRHNPYVEVNVVDPFARKGYRFKGTAEVLTDGAQYDAIVTFYRQRGTRAAIHAIVLIQVSHAAPLISPAYDDGTPEVDIRRRWERHYADLHHHWATSMEKTMPNARANELLGYPADARLLILNADDFGMYQAINEAILRTLKEGVVRSTTLMAPCPWASHAMQLLADNPDIAFGVHLTVICDLVNYRYGPLTSREKVPSLIDEAGYFYSLERIPEFLALAKLDELEIEFRAQIEAVLSAGLKPTHLDWHCLHSGGRADIFAMTLGLAKEYGLALRVAERPLIEKLQSQGLPTDDYDLLDSFRVDTVDKSARYAQMLRDLPVGLSEWAVHPSLGDAESQAIDDGWQVRRADFDFLISLEARELIAQEGIIVLNYKPLQEVWRSR